MSWDTVIKLSTGNPSYNQLRPFIQLKQNFLLLALKDLSIADDEIRLYQDNQSSIKILKNKNDKRRKHIDVRHHFLNQKVVNKDIIIAHIPSKEVITELLPKDLPKEAFNYLKYKFKGGVLWRWAWTWLDKPKLKSKT